jgi:Kef-type K+ transport system membrane component KefB
MTDIAICIVAAWVFGVVAQMLRQPVLLAYVLAGYAIGPQGMEIVTRQESVESIAEIGLILLLFVIGLEIDLKRVLGSGRAIVTTAAVEILGTIALGLLLFVGIGQPQGSGRFDALYLAVAAFVSSTVIAVKTLADRRQLDTLAGRITIGISVMQDVAVILFLGIQPALANPSVAALARTFAEIAALIGLTLGISRYVLPPLFQRVARLPELISVGALAWCFVVAALANALGLSREMGALVAGIALSTFPYHLDVTAKVTSLRDFFITLFFVGLGLSIPPVTTAAVGLAMVISAFVMASRILTVMVPLRALGLGNRVAVLTSLNLMPLSEFSLVMVTLGTESGHVDRAIFPPIVYAFFILAVFGSYAIGNSDRVFRFVEPWLLRLGMRDRSVETPVAVGSATRPDIYILGFSWTASSLLEEIARRKPTLLPRLAVIDFNPEVHRTLKQRKVHAIWGDISQRDTLEHAGLSDARLILCTLPNTVLRGITNVRLVSMVRSLNRDACVVAHAELLRDVSRLKKAGATYVSVSRLLEAEDLLHVIDAAEHRLVENKLTELEDRLANRGEVIP